jgi:hypothetical protein
MEDIEMGENQKKVLQLLAEGKINVDEAQQLLSLVSSEKDGGASAGNSEKQAKSLPRYIHVIVEPKPGASHSEQDVRSRSKVNIRVPLSLVRAGIKFAALMPSEAVDHMDRAIKDKGLSFDVKKLKEEDLSELVSALENSEINVDSEREVVRIYSE